MTEHRKGNIFSVLADSDSDAEEVPEVKESKGVRVFPQPFRRKQMDLHFLPDADEEPAKKQTKTSATPPILEAGLNYPSLLSRGSQVAEENKEKDKGSAMAWAEKVKQSLEKAEAARKPAAPYQPSEDFIASLGKLSFFRRGAVCDSASKD